MPPAEAYGVAAFYALFSTQPRPARVAHVCDDIACRLAGAEELCATLEEQVGPEGEAWSRSPCLGRCDHAPAALLTVAGPDPGAATLAPVEAGTLLERLTGESDVTARVPSADPPIPQLGQPGLQLLARVGVVDPASLLDYRAHGGYRALARAIALGRAAAIAEVTASGLLGRGGAAFPTGRKWSAVAAQPAQPHYVVCNADESEPGTFKDRVLLEHDPFAVVEAMTIEGFVVGAGQGYLYIRGEYPEAEARVAGAIRAAREAGLLGRDILGSGFAFDIELRRGAGAYICGEETALFASIEGYRGEPRNKPPYPVQAGLFGKPTAVNNVETLANVLLVLAEAGGGQAYAQMGTRALHRSQALLPLRARRSPGRLRGALRDDAAGAHRPGRRRARRSCHQGRAAGRRRGRLRGPGGPGHRLTFEGTRAIGASLGSGVVMVFDETVDLMGTLRRIAALLPRRVLRPVRALPHRHRAPGGAAGAARGGGGGPGAGGWPWRCWRTWARACATPPSADSARRPRRPSSQRCAARA